MTDTAEQKRPTLTLNRKTEGSDRKPHKTQQNAPQTPTGRKRKAIKARARKMAKLTEYWPDLFSPDNPKPLKVGVLDDLQRDVAARTLVFGAGSLKAALAAWTHRGQYQKALATGGPRYDLTGQPAGEVTAEQQQTAAALVEKAETRGCADGKRQ